MKERALFYYVAASFMLNALSADPVKLIPDDEIERIRENPSLIYPSYQAHSEELDQFLGADYAYLNSDEKYILYCAMAAYGLAPYGPSKAITLEAMLHSPFLHCGNYPILTVKLAEEGDSTISNKLHLPFVAWRGPAMAGHGVLFLIRSDRKDVFIDPTAGLIARASFDEVAGGKPVERQMIRDFAHRTELDFFKNKVIAAIVQGRIRPSELLYYYHSVDARNRCLPLDERTATPRSQMELFGPKDYLKRKCLMESDTKQWGDVCLSAFTEGD